MEEVVIRPESSSDCDSAHPILEQAIVIRSNKDAQRLVARLVNLVKTGKVSEQEGRALTYMLSQYVHFARAEEFEKRLVELRHKIDLLKAETQNPGQDPNPGPGPAQSPVPEPSPAQNHAEAEPIVSEQGEDAIDNISDARRLLAHFCYLVQVGHISCKLGKSLTYMLSSYVGFTGADFSERLGELEQEAGHKDLYRSNIDIDKEVSAIVGE